MSDLANMQARLERVQRLIDFLDRCVEHGTKPGPAQLAFALRRAVSDKGAAWDDPE